MRKVLPRTFFERSAVVVAEELIGKYLVRRERGVETSSMITETEAYEGVEDLACHASKGRTKRTEIMFGEAGYFYVYLIYGMYHMLNVVTGRKGHPAAVLVRAIDGVSGPGRLTRGLGIDGGLNTKVASKESGLWFEDRGFSVPRKKIEKTARIGVGYAGPVWSKKLWRFLYRADS